MNQLGALARKLVLFVLLVTMLLAGSVDSQSAEQESVFVLCYSEPAMSYVASEPKIQSPSSNYSDIELRDGCFEDVLDAIKANFQSVGIGFVASTKPTDRTPTAQIYFTLDIHGTPLVALWDLSPTQLRSSPVLSAHLTEELDVYATHPQARLDDANLITAVLLYSIGRCDLAMPYFEQAAKGTIRNNTFLSGAGQFNPPIFDFINFYKANCAILEGDYETARYLYETYVLREPFFESVNAAGNLGWTYIQLGKPQKAFVLLTKMIDLSQSGQFPESRRTALLFAKRSQLYALAFRYTEAIADMDAAIALRPYDPALYVERGQRIILTYDWDRALADYNHALELDPAYADAYYYRGILYASVPEGSDARRLALDDFRHYLELAPSGAHAADAAPYAAKLQAQLDALGSLG